MNAKIAAAAFIVMYTLIKRKENRKRRRRRCWKTPLLCNRRNNLLSSLMLESREFTDFTRMTKTDFEYLLSLISPKIIKKDTNFRKAISPRERLALSLRFLATGDSYSSLQHQFKVSKSSITYIIPEVCQAIVEVLREREYIKMPATSEEWYKVSQQFQDVWNFPNCIGSMDGKHVVLQNPTHGGSDFYNCKSIHNIIMFMLVDADYNIIFLDIGTQDRITDEEVFQKTELHHRLATGDLGLPTPKVLPGRQKEQPYVIVAEEVFPLEEHIMKPYSGYHLQGTPKGIFNYRLNRARRTVENVFGTMSAVFQVLRKPMLLEPKRAEIIVMATAYLHNFLRRHNSRNSYTPPDFLYDDNGGLLIEGRWRQEVQAEQESLLPLRQISKPSTNQSEAIRDEFAEYFVTNGAVEWQNK